MLIKLYGRDREIRALEEYVKLGKKVLIKGRRGIGKTALVKKVAENMRKADINVLYINCENITTPKSLLSTIGVKEGYILEPDEILSIFFKKLQEININILILDEFTILLKDFSKRKPYRGLEKVVAHLRGLTSEFDGAVLFTASSLWFIAKLLKSYERRLARMFNVVLKLDSLKLGDASKIAYDITKNEEESFLIANLGDSVPFYVESISLTRLRMNNPYESFREELTRGALNELFRALFNDLIPSAREVIYLLSEKPRTFESLEKEVLDDTLPYALEYLQEMDLVGKIERRRRTTYYLRDKTFGAWVKLNKNPQIFKEIKRITKILSLGFESIVRELFLNITMEIDIIDHLGNKIIFGPVDYVKRIELNGEIDLIANDIKNRVIIGEITIRGDPKRKIEQLLTNVEKVKEKLGIKEFIPCLITYNEPKEEITKLAKEENIHIITSRELNQIARTVKYRPI